MDSLWYTHVARTGSEPHCQRLARRSMAAQWIAAIQLALEVARGRAGWRQVWVDRTHEEIWYWPAGDEFVADNRTKYHRTPGTGWWIVPQRVATRARKIYEAAVRTACYAHGGSAYPEQVVAVLEAWARSRQWRRIASSVAPRHPGPGKRPRTKKRSGGWPAWAPRALPDLRYPKRPTRRKEAVAA